MADKEQPHRFIEQLPSEEIAAVEQCLRSLMAHEAPVDPEMLARIDAARADPSPGIPHNEILREFEL